MEQNSGAITTAKVLEDPEGKWIFWNGAWCKFVFTGARKDPPPQAEDGK